MKDLARNFVHAAQLLGDAMLTDLQAKDPTFAEAVACAVANGESLVVAFKVGGEPCIEMLALSDYKTVRSICMIPLQSGVPRLSH